MSDIEQGTDEWFAARLGKVTASRVADVAAKTKTGWGAARKNYAAELIAERLTGVTGSAFTNAAMQWGTDTEPQARSAYELIHDVDVVQVGFSDHPSIAMTGASPDGLVGDDGLVEIKCPNTSTHIDTLLNEKVPAKYITQMQWQMACTSRAWCDFVSYDPRLTGDLAFWSTRLERDAGRIAELEEIVSGFLSELDDTLSKLTERRPAQQAAE